MEIKKCEWVAKQTQEAKSGMVTVRSGVRLPVRFAYRCLYCGEYFNQKGAEGHFGKTRIEYNETRDPNARAEIITVAERVSQ